jgi:hypothetical protein
MKTGISGQKTSGHGGQDGASGMGDWAEDKK